MNEGKLHRILHLVGYSAFTMPPSMLDMANNTDISSSTNNCSITGKEPKTNIEDKSSHAEGDQMHYRSTT